MFTLLKGKDFDTLNEAFIIQFLALLYEFSAKLNLS
jgi:hypothetical protein